MKLQDWLRKAGLEQHAQAFLDNGIDLDVLGELSEKDLADLGLNLGDRKRLLRARANTHSNLSGDMNAGETAAQPETQEFARSAERRQLTVLFCDLIGSTALSQTMDAESLRDLMRQYQEACRTVIHQYEGHIAQYLGDGIMAYFGWPRAHENAAERALRAALNIVGEVKKIPAPSPLQVHIGIATGPVVVGETTGSEVGASKLAVGETPNLAARLQSLAGADEIVIAATTRQLAGAGFAYFDGGLHPLKGIVDPVPVHRLQSLRHIEGRFEAM